MSPQPIEESIGYLLAQVCKAHRHAANAALGEAGVHVGQEMVLMQLWQQGGMTQTELAEQLCVEAPTVTRMLQRMERADLISRCPDPDDARIQRVHVTEQGEALRQSIEQAWTTVETNLLTGFSLEERLLLRRFFAQMLQNLA